jgi:hypothetical protein
MFTAVTLITLAAGVGANTVVFSVLEGILLKPLPYPHSEQLVVITHKAPGIGGAGDFPGAPSNYFIYREQNSSLQDIAMMTGDSASITGIGEPEQVRTQRVTDGMTSILGAVPLLGRSFSRQDDQPNSPPTVVLMYGYWQRKFGGDRGIVGQQIKVDGKAMQIIGVMPKDFHFLDQEDPALLVPFQWDRGKIFLGNFSYFTVARLKPGATNEQARADVERMLPTVLASFPAPPGF